MRRIGEKGGSGRCKAQDAGASLGAQILLQVAEVIHQADQRLGVVGVEVVEDENPLAVGLVGWVRSRACTPVFSSQQIR